MMKNDTIEEKSGGGDTERASCASVRDALIELAGRAVSSARMGVDRAA